MKKINVGIEGLKIKDVKTKIGKGGYVRLSTSHRHIYIRGGENVEVTLDSIVGRIKKLKGKVCPKVSLRVNPHLLQSNDGTYFASGPVDVFIGDAYDSKLIWLKFNMATASSTKSMPMPIEIVEYVEGGKSKLNDQ